MTFRHDRRRRIFTDEVLSAPSAGDGSTTRQLDRPGAGVLPAAYSPAARRDRQPRLVDLVPSRYLGFAWWLLAGASVITLLEIFYAFLPGWSSLDGAANASALDLAGPNTLAAWFSASLLMAGAIVSVLIYALRRHRLDDYYGRYRIWLWTAAALVLLSMDQTTELHRVAERLLERPTALWGIRSGWIWIAAGVAIAGLVVVRLMFEMRFCTAAMAAMATSLGLLLTATAIERGWIPGGAESSAVMLAAGLRMSGHLVLVCGFGLYTRHVIRDAEGLLPLRPTTSKPVVDEDEVDEDEDAESEKPTAATPDPPQRSRLFGFGRDDLSTTSTTAKPSMAASSSAVRPSSSPATSAGSSYEGLSRLERKKLKREMKLKMREAQRA